MMSARRRGLVCTLVTAVAATLMIPGAGAAPNPYGRSSSKALIRLQPNGGYAVQLTQTQVLARKWTMTFGGAIHDGFRMPDDKLSEIPPYLRVTYRVETAALDGEPLALSVSKQGHLVMAEADKELGESEHTADISYTVAAAAVPTTGGFSVYYRHWNAVGSAQRVVTVDASTLTQAHISGLRCVTVAPDTVPCGERSGTTWTLTSTSTRPFGPDLIIDFSGSGETLQKPTIDRK